MTISVINAINDVRNDKKYLPKIIIMSIVCLLSLPSGMLSEILQNTDKLPFNSLNGIIITGIIIVLAISLIANVYWFGFMCSSMNKSINTGFAQLAELNEKNILLTGLKAWLTSILYSWILGFMFITAFLLMLIVFGIIFGIIYLIFTTLLHFEKTVICVLFGILGACLFTVITCYGTMFASAAWACYWKTLKFEDFVYIPKHFNIVKENQRICWTLVGKNLLLALIGFLICISLIATIVGVIIIPFIVVYFTFTGNFLVARFAKEIQIDRYMD